MFNIVLVYWWRAS